MFNRICIIYFYSPAKISTWARPGELGLDIKRQARIEPSNNVFRVSRQGPILARRFIAELAQDLAISTPVEKQT